MNNKFFLLITTILFLFPTTANANIMCNDGTTSPTCADCHRGCCSHHGGCASNSSSNSSNNSYSNNNNNSNNYNSSNVATQKVVEKSSDTSLKEIKIDDEPIDIKDTMSIDLKKEIINVEVTANDYKATVEYEKEVKLTNGINTYIIKVTAENSTIKYYTININNKLLSNNKKFKLYYNNKKLKINSKKKTVETITVSHSTTKVNLKAVLDDNNAKIKFTGIKKLKVGKNKVKIVVTAQDKSKKTYTMNIKRKNFFNH